jgi:hypothetical protein
MDKAWADSQDKGKGKADKWDNIFYMGSDEDGDNEQVE